MDLVTVGPIEGGPEQLEQSVRAAIFSMSTPPALVILYCPIDADAAAYTRAIRAVTTAPLVGATTGGAAFTERGFTRSGVCAGLFVGSGVDVVASIGRDLKRDAQAAVAAALEPIMKRVDVKQKEHSLLILSDAFAADGEALLDVVRNAVPTHFRVFGGTAGDGWTFKGTQVFLNDEVASDAVVLAGPFTGVPFAAMARHGFSAVDGGREFEITGIEGNILQSLDCGPAARVYRDELRRLGLLAPEGDLVKAMAIYELGARTPFREELKIRAPLGANDDGAVILASSLPKRSAVRIVSASPDKLVQAARDVAQRVYKRLRGGTHGALVFDCAARLQLLADRYGETVDAFRADRAHPVLGMACYGEMLRVGGTADGFHNTTAIVAAW
jgi:hypothetical protein